MLESTAPGTTFARTDQVEARRARLLADLDAAASIPGIDAAGLAGLRGKLAGRVFNLVVAGEFKRGKSSVINALLGAEVLPTGVVPLTSVVTILQHGQTPSAMVAFEDGARRSIALERLFDYVTERANPHNEKHVKDVEVAFPAPWLGQGIRLVDTPGIGSAYRHNSDVTYTYLPQADAVIFVASVDQPISHSELEFLANIRAHADRVFCLLNKIDHLSAAELAESVAFSSAALREALGAEVPMFPVSARTAMAARRDGAADALVRSGFAAFDMALRHFLQRDSSQVLVHSVRRHLSRLLAARRLAAELELKALTAPLESLTENLRAIDLKKAEILQQRSDFAALLEADARGLVRNKIEPTITDFKHTLAQRLDTRVSVWVEEAANQRDMSPQASLELRMVDEVRRAYDAFRQREDEIAYTEFDRICMRFQQRIGDSADELMAYAAELFAVPFAAVTTEPLRGVRSRFYYKFWQEPDSMGLLAQTLTGLLPRTMQKPLLRRRAHRRVAELVEMQAGRLRHDFDQRITQAVQVARKEMLGRIDATIESIEGAISKGRTIKLSGADAITQQQRETVAMLGTIAKLEARPIPM